MIKWKWLILVCGLFASCNTNDGGTEIPNELVGKELIAGKAAAADAEIRLIPVGFVPGSPGGDSGKTIPHKTTTDADGQFAFKDIQPGVYNLLASKDSLRSFRDSLIVTGKGQVLAPDTLRLPGSLTGKVELEPQHDPRSATVQVLGTTVFVNVSEDGFFTLGDLGAGEYRLRVVTVQPEYTPLLKEFKVRVGARDTLPEPLRPFFIGTPVIKGLSVTPGPDGTLVLRWSKPAFGKVAGYLIYRDPPGTLLPTQTPMDRVTDTFYVDSIYSRTPREGRQHSYTDTMPHSYSYRVKILDLSGYPGPSYGFVQGDAIPPLRSVIDSPWKRWIGELPISGAQNLVVFHDKLWLMYSGPTLDWGPDSLMMWSSSDAINWERIENAAFADSSRPSGEMVVFQDQLWTIGYRNAWVDEGVYNQSATVIWNSPDGSNWTEAAHSAILPGRTNCGISVFKNRLWLVSGMIPNSLASVNDIRSSANGIDWDLVASGIDISANTGNLIAFNGKLRLVGGGSPMLSGYNMQLNSSSDGATWNASPAPAGLLPRVGHSLTEHGGKLWLIGGLDLVQGTHTNDVWSSQDGQSWTLAATPSPFQIRGGHLSVSFKGKLWVMGGSVQNEGGTTSPSRDIWTYEGP